MPTLKAGLTAADEATAWQFLAGPTVKTGPLGACGGGATVLDVGTVHGVIQKVVGCALHTELEGKYKNVIFFVFVFLFDVYFCRGSYRECTVFIQLQDEFYIEPGSSGKQAGHIFCTRSYRLKSQNMYD